MAGRKRIPVEVREKTQKDNRKPHRSVKELEARKASEESINANLPDAEPPDYLTDPDKIDRFNEIVRLMKLAGPKTLAKALDSDAIAAYVDAQFNYEFFQNELNRLQKATDTPPNVMDTYSKLRNAAQTQCDKLRSVLALDPVSRLKIDSEPLEPKRNKFSDL